MPVYLFTFHAYRSWMPDHRRGYTRRGGGYLPPDEEMNERYCRAAKDEPTEFDRHLQRALIEELQTACAHQQLRFHGGSTEKSHVHGLVSWKSDKHWMRVRTALKTSLSMRLTREAERSRDATRRESEAKPEAELEPVVYRLSRGGSRKRVRDRKHFNYLMQTYLPGHSGAKWFEDRGCVD